MTMASPIRVSACWLNCENCGNKIIAPDCSENFSEERVIFHFWSCTVCGNHFETESALSAEVMPKSDYVAEETPGPVQIA
jgi:hypothetical protein